MARVPPAADMDSSSASEWHPTDDDATVDEPPLTPPSTPSKKRKRDDTPRNLQGKPMSTSSPAVTSSVKPGKEGQKTQTRERARPFTLNDANKFIRVYEQAITTGQLRKNHFPDRRDSSVDAFQKRMFKLFKKAAEDAFGARKS